MKMIPLIKAVTVGLLLFAAVYFLSGFVVPAGLATQYPWLSQVVMKAILALASVVLALVLGVPRGQFSLRAGYDKKLTRRLSLYGFLSGMLATGIILLFGVPSIPLLKQLNSLQLILVVWIWSSVCEELFARGLVQGLAAKLLPGATGRRISFPVLAGAVVFSLIHFSIYLKGGALSTTAVIMAFTFLLGVIAGVARERSNMRSAIYVHIAFNIGGFFCGFVVNIAWMLATGHLLVH